MATTFDVHACVSTDYHFLDYSSGTSTVSVNDFSVSEAQNRQLTELIQFDIVLADIEHASCLEASAAPNYVCAACNEPLGKSLYSSEIGKAVRNRIKSMPGLQSFVKAAEDLERKSSSRSKPMSRNEQGTNNFESISDGQGVERTGSANKYRRQNAALQIIETDLAQSISQVSQEVGEQSVDTRLVNSEGTDLSRADSVINIDMPKAQQPGSVGSSVRQGPNVKKEKAGALTVTSVSVRKALKAGARRWFDFRKSFFESQKQMSVLMVFLVCVAVLVLLMSGDEGDAPMSAKPAVEDITLPYVRVNPVLFAESNGEKKLNDVRTSGA